MILNHVIRRAVRYFPDRTATICEGRRQSYRELGRRVQALARALSRLGIGRGDRVAIYLLNSAQFLETVYACFELNAVVVPLNTRLAAEELVFIINDAECKAFLTDELLLPAAASFKDRLQGIEHFIALGGGAGFADYETLIGEAGNDVAPLPLSDDASDEELAGLFYTSGTTGLPKGVMLSHRNLWMNALHTLAARAPEPQQNFLHAAPMFHLATFPAAINVTINGGTHTILRKFDLKTLMELIEHEHVTSTVLVPTMINFLINHPDFSQHNLSSLRRITYGASPMPVELLKRTMEAMPGVEFFQGYGQTESSPLLTALLPEDHHFDGDERLARRLGSCGRPVAGVEVEVVNDQGQPVKLGEAGEVVARGPNVMMGYWKRPEETDQTLRGGWLHTGDVGTLDEEGLLTLKDRSKDVIISGGSNIYPREVEEVLLRHPAVAEVSVVGEPDAEWGENVVAFVVARPGAALDTAELDRLCLDNIARFKRPKRYQRIDALPKNMTGKVLKTELRTLLKPGDA